MRSRTDARDLPAARRGRSANIDDDIDCAFAEEHLSCTGQSALGPRSANLYPTLEKAALHPPNRALNGEWTVTHQVGSNAAALSRMRDVRPV